MGIYVPGRYLVGTQWVILPQIDIPSPQQRSQDGLVVVVHRQADMSHQLTAV